MWPDFSDVTGLSTYPASVDNLLGTLVPDVADVEPSPKRKAVARPAVDRAKLKAVRKRGRKGRGK